MSEEPESDAIKLEKAEAEIVRLRSAIQEVIADWKEQVTANENGWSYRRGNNTFNEGAAFVLQHTLSELEDIIK